MAVAVRPEGVRPATFEEVTGGDALAVLRPRLGPLATARLVALALHHVGKPWDPAHDPDDPRGLDTMELLSTLLRPGDGVDEGFELPRRTFLGAPRQHLDDLAGGGPDGPWDLVLFRDATGPGDGAAFSATARRTPWTLAP